MAHRIRLRHPWEERVDLVSDQDSVSDQVESAFEAGYQVTYSRRFNRPTGLTDEDRLELEVIAPIGEIVGIRLNQQALPIQKMPGVQKMPEVQTSPGSPATVGGQRMSIQDEIQDHNELQIVLRRPGRAPENIEVQRPDRDEMMFAEVNLWIVSPDDGLPGR